MNKRRDGSQHLRDLSNRPDEVINVKTAYAQIHMRNLIIGFVTRMMTWRRLEFLANSIPAGLSVSEFLILLLDEEIERHEKDKGETA